MAESVKRPTVNDTEEDLLRMQEEMFRKKEDDELLLMRKNEKETDAGNRLAGKSWQINRDAGRFCLDLDALAEKEIGTMKFVVQERNMELLYNVERFDVCSTSINCESYAKEDGFPDVLDLSRYYANADEIGEELLADGRSLFAIEFDRIHGKIADFNNAEASTSFANAKPVTNNIDEEIELENIRRIEKMSKQEIEKAKQEIMERFDPKLLDFLRRRAKKKTEQRKVKEINSSDISYPISQQMKNPIETASDVILDVSGSKIEEVTDKIKQLEIFDVEKDNQTFHENLKASTLDDPYLRLAADVAQMDIATKCIRTIIPRQQQNIVRMFDNLRIPPKNYAGNDDLLEKARANLNAIKGLYLEQRKDKSGNISVQFADGINPFENGGWMLAPIRKVLDVMQKDGETTANDLVIVRLALFWTLLIMVERPTLFFAFATPAEIYVRLAEIFIMGPEIFKDDNVSQCVSRFLNDYLVPKARDGYLCLILKEPIAGLDAFEPFYEDLLRHFEEFSMSDDNFTLFILLGAYANQRLLDGLLMKCAVWAPNRDIVRQITTKKDSGVFLLDLLAVHRMKVYETIEKKHFAQFGQLVGMYAAAIRNDNITRDRNPLVYEIASRELGYFVQRHTIGTTHDDMDSDMVKNYDALVHILRQSLAGRLELK